MTEIWLYLYNVNPSKLSIYFIKYGSKPLSISSINFCCSSTCFVKSSSLCYKGIFNCSILFNIFYLYCFFMSSSLVNLRWEGIKSKGLSTFENSALIPFIYVFSFCLISVNLTISLEEYKLGILIYMLLNSSSLFCSMLSTSSLFSSDPDLLDTSSILFSSSSGGSFPVQFWFSSSRSWVSMAPLIDLIFAFKFLEVICCRSKLFYETCFGLTVIKNRMLSSSMLCYLIIIWLSLDSLISWSLSLYYSFDCINISFASIDSWDVELMLLDPCLLGCYPYVISNSASYSWIWPNE